MRCPLVVLTLALLLGACTRTSSVAITVPTPPPEIAQACHQAALELPATLEGQARREAEQASPLTAAWGDPPIAWRCGVQIPAQYSPTAQLSVINGVSWLPVRDEATRAWVFTTIGRVANVEVHVPDAYSPASNVLVDVSTVVSAIAIRP